MDSAIIRKSSYGVERYLKREPAGVCARIKYAVRIPGITGRHAVVIAGPGPIDDVAGVDGDLARLVAEDGLPHDHIRCRRGSESREQDQKCEKQSEIHFEDSRSAYWAAGYHGNVRPQLIWDERPRFWDEKESATPAARDEVAVADGAARCPTSDYGGLPRS